MAEAPHARRAQAPLAGASAPAVTAAGSAFSVPGAYSPHTAGLFLHHHALRCRYYSRKRNAPKMHGSAIQRLLTRHGEETDDASAHNADPCVIDVHAHSASSSVAGSERAHVARAACEQEDSILQRLERRRLRPCSGWAAPLMRTAVLSACLVSAHSYRQDFNVRRRLPLSSF